MKKNRWILALLALYLLVLALIAFWPTPVDRPIDVQLNIVLTYLQTHDAPTWINYAFVESAANVVLFVPFGLLMAAAVPLRRWWLAILVGVGASVCIELGQLLFLSERYATVKDVEVNTLGAVLGTLVVLVFRGWRGHRSRVGSAGGKRIGIRHAKGRRSKVPD
ncbi:VanZ family protein [Paenarthrobacter sp. Z7-10]|uniref:VanZ family protein n=1 Tax=Paenarthrobacter sp. Z7-10 TaxID=2787635 RepID=UPI0022A97EE0|nr:VanZ family protein [Paenarthrobacter sp. Z7-10]MCZ2402927.1 VanZ family protein [Paenarthrobacter sp. Z7-10]